MGYLETLLRATLTRCIVSTASLTRVVEITSQLYRKAAASVQGNDVPLANPILLALLETITDGVHMRARVPGSTLAALFDVCLQATTQTTLTLIYDATDHVNDNSNWSKQSKGRCPHERADQQAQREHTLILVSRWTSRPRQRCSLHLRCSTCCIKSATRYCAVPDRRHTTLGEHARTPLHHY